MSIKRSKRIKNVPHHKIVLLKQYIKDLTVDIKSVESQIEVLTSTILYSAKVKNNAIASEAWPAARKMTKVQFGGVRQLERLACVKSTLEAVREKYARKCRQLRRLLLEVKSHQENLNTVSRYGYSSFNPPTAVLIQMYKTHLDIAIKDVNEFEVDL